ncbi:MAG: META domain-containing protein [Ginsengibacter sp.]
MKTLSISVTPLLLLIIFTSSFRGRSSDKMNTPLIGTHWNLVALNGQMVAPNATSKSMYLEFKADSTVSGNGGCNAFSGNFSTNNKNEISFGDMVRTNVLCNGINNEKKFLDALAKSDHYKISNDTLILRNQMVDMAKLVAGKK